MKDKKVVPNFKVVEIDNSHHWDKSITDRGTVTEVYLVDENTAIHACSLSASRYYHFLYFLVKANKEGDQENLENEVDECCHSFQNATLMSGMSYLNEEKVEVDPSECEILDVEENYDRLVETLIDDCRSNHLI